MGRPPKPAFRGGIVPTSTVSALADLADYAADPPGVIARRITNQSIASGAATAISFDATVGGDAAMFTPTTIDITINDDGLYIASGWVDMDAGTVGIRQLEIIQNGTSVWKDARNAPSSLTCRMSITGMVSCASGDKLELWVFQSQGANLNVTAGRYGVCRISG